MRPLLRSMPQIPYREMSRMQAERESVMVQDTLMLHGKQIQHMRRVPARREQLQTVFKLDSKSVCLSIQL